MGTNRTLRPSCRARVRALSSAVISLMSWLAKADPSFQEPRLSGLPDPNDSAAAADGLACESANSEIVAVGLYSIVAYCPLITVVLIKDFQV